jgi:hypothetical protein
LYTVGEGAELADRSAAPSCVVKFVARLAQPGLECGDAYALLLVLVEQIWHINPAGSDVVYRDDLRPNDLRPHPLQIPVLLLQHQLRLGGVTLGAGEVIDGGLQAVDFGEELSDRTVVTAFLQIDRMIDGDHVGLAPVAGLDLG